MVRQAWRYLFETWEENSKHVDHDWHDLKALIDMDGWNHDVIMKYAAINRPYLKIEPSYCYESRPPDWEKHSGLTDIFNLTVEYPSPHDYVEIPDKWLVFAIRELRKNLEHTVYFESRCNRDHLASIRPNIPHDGITANSYVCMFDLEKKVESFALLFIRLIDSNISAARNEFAAWPIDDDTIFSRLRIWASGKSGLISVDSFGPIITSLSHNAFWDFYHETHLLRVLANRWNELSIDTRKDIEGKLLVGPPRRPREKNARFAKRRAWEILDRITWLANKACAFTSDLDAETERLRSIEPRWMPEYAAKAVESMEPRGGWVRTETGHSSLLHEPLSSILSKALELNGSGENFLVQNDPFARLSAEHPVLAFRALTNATKRSEYAKWAWAWRTFLNSEARKDDKPKFTALIAEHISRCPSELVADIIHSVSDWILKISKQLAAGFPRSFDKAMSKLINVLCTKPPKSKSINVRGNKEPDWIFEAINAPTGKIAQALFNDPRLNDLPPAEGLPSGWLAYVDDLLSLDGDPRRHALVIFAGNLKWFYAIDPNWAESNLLSALEGEDQNDRNAAWSGFFRRGTTPNHKLYVRMKAGLLSLAREPSLSRIGRHEALAGIILSGWGNLNEDTGERYISNDEMRDVILNANDGLRSRILGQVETWSKTQEKNGAGKTWSEISLELLRDAWPRQKSVKTPSISAPLFILALSNAERFQEMAEVVLPLLTKVDNCQLIIHKLITSKDNIPDRYPRHTLALLHAVLPDNVAAWPSDIEVILQRIGDADSRLKQDQRLLELNRKWNGR